VNLRAYLDVTVGETLSRETVDRLESLDRLLVRWGSAVDLEGFASDTVRYRRYFGEALEARPWLPPRGRAVDIGSGGGSPALPLAAARRELSWTLVESNERKVLFLEEAVRAVGLASACIVRARYETWAPGSPVDVMTVRGVSVSEPMRDKMRAELRPGGRECDYCFKCPSCTSEQRRHANSRVVSVLLATGVQFEVVNPDPITEEEIVAFMAALETEPDPLRLLAG